MLRGSTGILRPRERFVVAVFGTDGFTRFTLPANRNRFSLVPFQVDFVSISSFQLRVTDIASNGAALKVRVDYYTSTTVVSVVI